MVALGTNWDYAKDTIFHIVSILWLIYGELRLIVAIFDIANEIDQPIPCLQVPVENARQSVILSHCEWKDDVDGGSYVIPYDAWSAERFWFDFIGVNIAISFAIVSFLFLIGLVLGYRHLFSLENADERHAFEARLDYARNFYTLMTTTITFNFFFLYSTVLNKLIAFGAWERQYAVHTAQGLYSEGAAAATDVNSWTDVFQPDFGAIFDLSTPERDAPLYLGSYVKNVAVFTAMTLMKNIYIVMITAITDDMHIVSFFLNTPFALAVIAFCFVPYLAAMYCWKCIELSNALEFNFEFDHLTKTATFGGILFGISFQPQLFSSWVMPSIVSARIKWDVYVKGLKENGNEPEVFDLTFFQDVFLALARKHSLCHLCTFITQGITGLSCLGWAAYEVDDESAIESFWLLAGFTMAGACGSCALGACRSMGMIGPDPDEKVGWTLWRVVDTIAGRLDLG